MPSLLMLDDEEHFQETFVWWLRNYCERERAGLSLSSWLPNVTKRLMRPAVAPVSTNADLWSNREKTMSKHLLNIPCIISWLFFLAAPSICSNNETDFQALSAFKKAIESDPNGALNSWNETVPLCSWQGVSCSRRHQNRVSSIDLMSRGLIGSLSPHIGNLSFLRAIILQNNSFYGQIPDDIGRLRRLRLIDFSNNSFTGEIPRNLSQCMNINYLNLIDNNLTGFIIPEIDSLRELKALGLGFNHFSGGIPQFVGNLTSLFLLSLRNCGIRGEIPNSLVQLQYLETIVLDENNLTGTIPLGLFNISTIYTISVLANRLQGTIPNNIGLTLPRLRFLDLAENNFTGLVPFSLSNCSMIQVIHLSLNSFTGMVNVDFTRLFDLEHFPVTYNQLVGDLNFISSMRNCTKLKNLNLQGNLLSGSLPTSISNLSSQLSRLSLGENQLHGSIPSGIQNLLGLSFLNLEINNLEGPIPFDMGKLNKLQAVYLGGNRLTNEIPFSFGNLSLLNYLTLNENSLHGNIPQSLSNCSNLLLLDMSRNNLSGSVPREIMSLSSISISLNLSHNAFTGSIPSEVGSLTNLASLDLSHNSLSGEVPVSLGSCVQLVQLYLESNSFLGEIPSELSALRGLQYVDISQNNLSGTIPRFLGELDLAYLNLSFNRLEGEIPTSKVFLNGSAISLGGNNDLCGGIPSLNFPPCSLKSSMKKHFPTVFIILITILGVGAVCIVVSVYFFMHKRKKSRDTQSSMPPLKGDHLRLSYADLLRSTSGFSDGNLLGEGGFGSVYKGILGDGQTMVAVKVLNLNAKGASKSFVRECTILRGIRHRNLVKIESVCSSTDFQGNDFKALVYEYMANGNLDEWLHGKSEDETRRTLSLKQRLNIAIGVASALEYLHFGTDSVIVHGDLKPSNILLDEEMTARVGDFGLAKVVPNRYSTLHENSSSIGIKGTIGYIPPEYGMSGVVSTEGDVYSFGIVLLEMFTGRRPTDDSSSLCDFVKSELPSGAMEILDPIILDEYTMKSKIKNHIVSILEIGVACSVEQPRERMLMADVVSKLNKIVLIAES